LKREIPFAERGEIKEESRRRERGYLSTLFYLLTMSREKRRLERGGGEEKGVRRGSPTITLL